MRRNHLMPCMVMLGAAVLIAVVWGVQLGTLALFGLMLLCPLAMLLMMRAMAASGHAGGDRNEHSQSDTAP